MALVMDEPAVIVAECSVCCAAFPSRNLLFRHLREQPECAKVGGLIEQQVAEPPPAQRQPLDAEARAAWKEEKDREEAAARRKKKEKKAAPKAELLRLETRPESYQDELRAKVAALKVLFSDVGAEALPAVEVSESPAEHFRMRAEFDVWHDNSGSRYVMFNGRERVTVQSYRMGAKAINDVLMPGLLTALQKEEHLRRRLFQVNFHVTLHGDSLVSLLYHTPVDRSARRERVRQQAEERTAFAKDDDEVTFTPEWEAAATRLHDSLQGASIVGRARRKMKVVGKSWVEERLKIAGVPEPIRYRQVEGEFAQPNAHIAQQMLAWARAVARDDSAEVGSSGPARSDDLLELYCGNGHFCLALAACFRRVLATELVKALVDAAELGAADNGVTNLQLARVSAEELAQALGGERSFQRLAHVDLESYSLRTVLVDPPRAGLGPQVASCLAKYPRIVYISCNPETARTDLAVLGLTHCIRRFAAFDQFPYTHHLEMGMLLVRRED